MYIIILLTHLVSALVEVPALHLFMLVNWNRRVFYWFSEKCLIKPDKLT